MKEEYQTIFVSDVHLCSKDCHADEFLIFLKTVKCKKLYIVGDFFDIWMLKKRWLWSDKYNHIIQRLLKMSRKGTEVIYIPGNHDEMFREYVGHDFGGVKIMLNDTHQTVDGKRFFVTHGDEFDAIVKYNKWLAVVGSHAYDYLLMFNRIINWHRRILGREHWSLAAFAKKKVKNASVYIDRFEEAVIQETKRRGTDGVICGHIHTPVLRDFEGKIYCNTGDWVENCSFLAETYDGKLKLMDWRQYNVHVTKDITDEKDITWNEDHSSEPFLQHLV